MGRFLKWLSIFGALIAAIILGFSLYANLLLDYSLENLESALSATDKSLAIKSPVVKSLYKKLVYDIALEETAAEDSDIQDVVLLGLASRSMEENIERAGYERASIYLNQVSKSKQLERNKVLAFTDKVYSYVDAFYSSLLKLVRYIQVRVFSSMVKKEKKLDYADLTLLQDAEEAQNKGDFSQAIQLYKQYLSIYPRRSEYGFVSLSLAHIYIRQHKLDEALKILNKIQLRYVGSQEQKLAASFIKRIKAMQSRESDIKEYQNDLRKLAPGSEQREGVELKLALSYLASYQFQPAEKLLLTLMDAKDREVRAKSKFYLSRIYKEYRQYDQAIGLLKDLLTEEGLSEELKLGLQAELADQYYLNKEPEKAAQSYEILGESVGKKFSALDAAQRATKSLGELRETKLYSDWAAVAEIEQANIYLFDFGDNSKAEESLSRLNSISYDFSYAKSLNSGIRDSAQLSLRDRAFEALRTGEIHASYDMFKRNVDLFARDGWSYAGLATTYVLLANLDEAEKAAQKAVRFKPDEYTLSILAYVQGYKGEYEKSIQNYKSAIHKDTGYSPAIFNLGCMYLETERYAEAYELFEGMESKLGLGQGFMKSKVLNNMGYAVWRLGNAQKARAFFEEALKKTPNFVLAAKNLRKLAVGDTPEMQDFKDES